MSQVFKQRGLPHAHMVWLRENRPGRVDGIVSAETQCPVEYPELHKTVNTIHGPCGVLNPKPTCVQSGMCSKRYTKKYITETQMDQGFPLYRRRSPGEGGRSWE